MATTPQRVLVTGGSGFIAGHCILALLSRGYQVRTIVRSLEREPQVRAALSRYGREPGDALTFVAADLMDDAGRPAAVDGCDFVLHVASPLPHGIPENADSVIRPSREGTVRVLRAARDAGVKRVMLTSAFGIVGFGYGRTDQEFTDGDWSIIDGPGVNAYNKNKILAELAGEIPAYPDFWFPLVDVRDVATAHVLAMKVPEAAGQRFIIGTGIGMTMKENGLLLKEPLGERTSRVPTRSIPSFMLRLAAPFSMTVRELVPDLGVSKKIDTSKSRSVLGWEPRPPREAILACAESILELGLVKA